MEIPLVFRTGLYRLWPGRGRFRSLDNQAVEQESGGLEYIPSCWIIGPGVGTGVFESEFVSVVV